MQFSEVKPNNRIQIECESEIPIYRNIKGIVVEAGEKSMVLVTDYGELTEIFEDKILSISQINFPKIVSDSLVKFKSYYTDIYELEYRLKKLREQESAYKEDLYDANFLARFNIKGAKNRLENSIDPSLLHFTHDTLSYTITFQSNPNSQIEIYVLVANQIEYQNLDVHNKDKIIRIHAPRAKEMLNKFFPYATKAQELENSVVHEGDSLYSIRSLYKQTVDVSQENFLEVRINLIKSLSKLKK